MAKDERRLWDKAKKMKAGPDRDKLIEEAKVICKNYNMMLEKDKLLETQIE